MSSLTPKEVIAKRVAQEFKDGQLVNLGVGIPTLVPKYLPDGVQVWLESENGIIGGGPPAEPGQEDPFCVDAGKFNCTIKPGGCTFNSQVSFGLIRGGHLDYTVLGAFQVSQTGDIANWMIPGGKLAGMGGAMDLVTGAKKVIVATEHCDRNGGSKILKECTYPLTGEGVVDFIVTELAFIEVTDKGLVLREISPETSVEEVVSKTGVQLIVADDVKVMAV